jgi:uroporphyrinogen-III synthase
MALQRPPAWYVISLRPQGQHASLRRAAHRHGARLLALSPWRLQALDDDDTRDRLRQALQAEYVLFTSPAAVRFAERLRPLQGAAGQTWLAVGSGTASALRRAGVAGVHAPARMDSEGLLALPELQGLHGRDLGLVSAPAGRDLLATTLAERGARLLRADVYRREPLALAAPALASLRAMSAPACLLLSSGGALVQVLERLPADLAARLRETTVIAASARLLRSAQDSGFRDAELAAGPRPAQMLSAAEDAILRRFR